MAEGEFEVLDEGEVPVGPGEKPDPPLADRYVEVFTREDALFDWRRVSRRGNLPDEIVANSAGQGFTTVRDAIEAAERENEGLEIIVHVITEPAEEN